VMERGGEGDGGEGRGEEQSLSRAKQSRRAGVRRGKGVDEQGSAW